MREAGVCALFYRLSDDTPVMCGYERPCALHDIDEVRRQAHEQLFTDAADAVDAAIVELSGKGSS